MIESAKCNDMDEFIWMRCVAIARGSGDFVLALVKGISSSLGEESKADTFGVSTMPAMMVSCLSVDTGIVVE